MFKFSMVFSPFQSRPVTDVAWNAPNQAAWFNFLSTPREITLGTMRRPVHEPRDLDLGAMTPMIDIVFLLLIFFVVTASAQIRELLLPTELSASGAVDVDVLPPESEPLTIDVWLKLSVAEETGRTVVDMNGTLYRDLDELKAQLRTLAELGPENPIILDIQPDVPLGDIVDVYDTCQSAGFESVSFAADPQ